jgi:predicted Zn finger-like uncharacterized protein
MKISCQACGTKYTIADDKVRGRKVRVRCKSCSTPIVVDTAQAAAEAEAAAPPPDAGAAPDAVEPWTVNLSDTEQRTMTTDEIVTGYHAGTVTEDAFVWKEGMDDWVPLLEQPDLRSAIEAYGTAAPAAQPAAAQPAAPAAPAFPAPPADPSPYAAEPPWASPAAPAAAAPAAAPAPAPTPAVPAAAARIAGGRSRGAADLFGGVDSAGSEEEALRNASLPGSTAYDAKVTGARNENSVLFSLDSLKAGFAAPKQPPPKAGAPKRPGGRPGMQSAPDDPFGMSQGNSGVARLGGGGNALFSMGDNQALMMAPPPPPEPPPPPVVTDPVGVEYAPAPAAKKGPDKRLFVLGGGAALVLVLGIGIAVAVSGGKKEEPVAEADSKREKSEKESDKAEKKSEDTNSEKTEAKADETKAESEPAATSPSAAAAEKKPPTEEEKKRFAEAQKKEQEKKEADKAPEKKELPVPTDGPAFNKGAAIAALSSAASASTSCKRPGGPTGSGKVLVTFAPSGRVTSANVAGGAFGGTSVGGCVASVFRRAKVPPFGGGPVTVSKSFSIKP